MNNLGLAIHGAAGRMGQRLVALASVDEQFNVVAAFESAEHPRAGKACRYVGNVAVNVLPSPVSISAMAP